MQRNSDPAARRDVADPAPTLGADSERVINTPLHHVELLAAAAEAAAHGGIELDAFMSAAWAAFMEARPGLREQIEHVQLVAQLESMRQAGKLGQA
jgi:hypothetical protein